MTPKQDNELRDLLVKIYGDNALESAIGLLSSITTEQQGDVLLSTTRAHDMNPPTDAIENCIEELRSVPIRQCREVADNANEQLSVLVAENLQLRKWLVPAVNLAHNARFFLDNHSTDNAYRLNEAIKTFNECTAEQHD